MSVTIAKGSKLQTILDDPSIQEMVVIEPELLQVLSIASDPEPRENRWISYSALKRMMRNLVGWDARQSELRSTRHYNLMIRAIDDLLPLNEVEECI